LDVIFCDLIADQGHGIEFSEDRLMSSSHGFVPSSP
jgi:hypothetical protein